MLTAKMNIDVMAINRYFQILPTFQHIGKKTQLQINMTNLGPSKNTCQKDGNKYNLLILAQFYLIGQIK